MSNALSEIAEQSAAPLSCRGLCKTYRMGDVSVRRSTTLIAHSPGELVALLGASGSGWLMKRSNETFGLTFKSHRLRGNRRVLDISNAKSMKERTPLYRDLLKITARQ